MLLGLRLPCWARLREEILLAAMTVDRNREMQMSTRTAMIMKQISMRDLLPSQVSLVIGLLGLLLFSNPLVVETALGAGEVKF